MIAGARQHGQTRIFSESQISARQLTQYKYRTTPRFQASRVGTIQTQSGRFVADFRFGLALHPSTAIGLSPKEVRFTIRHVRNARNSLRRRLTVNGNNEKQDCDEETDSPPIQHQFRLLWV